MSHHLTRAYAAQEQSRLATLRARRAIARAQRAAAAAQRARDEKGRTQQLTLASLYELTALRQQQTALALREQAALERQHELEHGDDPVAAAAREAR